MLSLNSQVLSKRRKRPGHIVAMGVFSGLVLFTYGYGHKLDTNLKKHILAGTMATVGVELCTHAIDTINMNSKVI